MKTPLTLEIEQALIKKCKGTAQRYALEVSFKNGFVDFATATFSWQEQKPIIKFYEIKVSLNDFKSANGHNFGADENYYVMPIELLNEIIEKDASLLQFKEGIIVFENETLKLKKEQDSMYFFGKKKITIEDRFYLLDQILMRWVNGSMSNDKELLEVDE